MINSTETAYQPKDVVKLMQAKKMQQLIRYVAKKSPFYRELIKWVSKKTKVSIYIKC